MPKLYLKKIFLISSLLLLSANVCFAAQFPKVKEIYNDLIKAGAGLALLAIIYGGVRLILSAGDPGLKNEAKTWLRAGIFGLIIIAAAGTIYKGITGEFPSFQVEGVTPETPYEEEKKPPGIYLCSGLNCKESGEKIVSEAGLGTKSVEIINGETVEYLVVAKSIDDQCQEVFKAGCHNLDFTAASIYSYQFNPKAKGKIIFYKKPYYKSDKHVDELNGELKQGLSPDFTPASFKSVGDYVIILYNEERECEVYEPQLVGNKLGRAQGNLKIQRLFSRSEHSQVTIIPAVF